MLNSYIDFVFHLRARNLGTPTDPVYSYNANPEFRVIQGWCKHGLNGLNKIGSYLVSMYSEIPYSEFKVKKDFIITRRGLSALDQTVNPSLAITYAPVKLRMKWNPNKRITFNTASSVAVAGGAPATACNYTGWTPFMYVFNPHNNLDIVVDHLKRVNLFKDL